MVLFKIKISLEYLEADDDQFVNSNEEQQSGHISEEPNPKMAATDHTAVELSYCSVKNGVNDMLDYIALVVALVAPLIIGPCIVGVFQVILLENDQHRHFLLSTY